MVDEIDYTNPEYIPVPSEYVRFLKTGHVTDFERKVLLALYAARGALRMREHIGKAENASIAW
jgi:hypothetical protein